MTSKTKKVWLMGSATPAYPARFCSYTEGRQVLPDILQDAYGLNSITGVHRYGQTRCAVVSLDAVRMLAGYPVENEVRIRIANASQNLIKERDRLGLRS